MFGSAKLSSGLTIDGEVEGEGDGESESDGDRGVRGVGGGSMDDWLVIPRQTVVANREVIPVNLGA